MSPVIPAAAAAETFDGTWPFRTRYSHATGFRMHFVDEGAGPEMLLLLHGGRLGVTPSVIRLRFGRSSIESSQLTIWVSAKARCRWFRSYRNENWEFDDDGLMRRREASINDYVIDESEREFHFPLGPRTSGNPGLEELVK